MLNYNGRIYFLAALYHIRGGFSRLSGFVRQFAGHLNSIPFEQAPVLKKVQQLREEYSNINGTIGDAEALKLMLAEDLYEVENALRNNAICSDIDNRQNIHAVLNKYLDKAVDQLLSIGVHIDSPTLNLVEKLPAPYASQGYSSFVADQGDFEFYNIKPSIYFAQNNLRPFYSEFLLGHELVHVILGKINPNLSARGLEEGLAELIGAMYLSSRILGKELTTNLFIYNRLSYGQQQFWELYMDVTRQATMLYHRFGLQGVVHLMNSGREKLKEVENYCLRMEFDQIDLPTGQFDRDLTDISDFLSLAFSRNLVVSPLAKYLSRFVRSNSTIADVLTEANVDREAGMRAIKELKRRVYLTSFLDDSDDFGAEYIRRTDCDRLCKGPLIRYEIPEPTRT